MNLFRYIMATVLAISLILSWMVLHEQEHQKVYEEYGCNTSGLIWNSQTLVGVVPYCSSDRYMDQINTLNAIIDLPSQFFVPAVAAIWILCYLFMVNQEKEVQENGKKGGEKDGKSI